MTPKATPAREPQCNVVPSGMSLRQAGPPETVEEVVPITFISIPVGTRLERADRRRGHRLTMRLEGGAAALEEGLKRSGGSAYVPELRNRA